MIKKLYIVLIVVFAFACRKESDTFEGPSIEELYGDFSVLSDFSVSSAEVDFAAGEETYFMAQFNKTVDWTITITGKSSGAVKTISDRTKEIDASNATWNGSTTEFPVFAAEDCEAVLTIVDVADTFRLDLKTLSPKPNEGLVLADFETTGFDPDWTVFIQSGADMDFAVHMDPLAPHGGGYLNMAGTVNWDWLIGLIDFNAAAYGTNGFELSTDPSAVYFNCMVYGEPSFNKSLILFRLDEDENGDGTFDPNTEDQYSYELWVDWEGWKLVSIPYNSFQALVNGQPSTPNGNGSWEPNKLDKLSMLHLADPAQGQASTKIDYLIFTDAPLEP